jgi:hypothetical protein
VAAFYAADTCLWALIPHRAGFASVASYPASPLVAGTALVSLLRSDVTIIFARHFLSPPFKTSPRAVEINGTGTVLCHHHQKAYFTLTMPPLILRLVRPYLSAS